MGGTTEGQITQITAAPSKLTPLKKIISGLLLSVFHKYADPHLFVQRTERREFPQMN